jgi:hypothetical protein
VSDLQTILHNMVPLDSTGIFWQQNNNCDRYFTKDLPKK